MIVAPEHIQWQTHSVGLLWTTDRPVTKASTCMKHHIHKRQTSIHTTGFEPTIQASKLLQTHTLGHTATGISLNG